MARSTPPREGRVGQIAADPTEFCAGNRSPSQHFGFQLTSTMGHAQCVVLMCSPGA